MSVYRLRIALLAWFLLSPAGMAAPLQLTLSVNDEARQFLIDTGQQIIVVLPEPSSPTEAMVVAVALELPLVDSAELILELDRELYVSSQWVLPLGEVVMSASHSAQTGRAYRFDGRSISEDGPGLPGYLSLYFDAPPNARPVQAGLAGFVYWKAAGRAEHPSPLRYFTAQRMHTQIVASTEPLLWVFVGSGIGNGSTLPRALLRPAAPVLTSAPRVAARPTNLQFSRYAAVKPSAGNTTILHFDRALGAFVEGPYPETP